VVASQADGGSQPAPTFDPELDQLYISISAKTVESHVSSVLRKLQLSTRHQLTK
jgi:hypothetical protein